MSSDGGNGAVGRHGGSHQRRGNGRETGLDQSSCASKKKQKDRANQESREAKRVVAVVDGVIAEIKKGNNNFAFSNLCLSVWLDLGCAVNIRIEYFKLNFIFHGVNYTQNKVN